MNQGGASPSATTEYDVLDTEYHIQVSKRAKVNELLRTGLPNLSLAGVPEFAKEVWNLMIQDVQFYVPVTQVIFLCGPHNSFIQHLEKQSGAKIHGVERAIATLSSPKRKILRAEGTMEQVSTALAMVQQRLLDLENRHRDVKSPLSVSLFLTFTDLLDFQSSAVCPTDEEKFACFCCFHELICLTKTHFPSVNCNVLGFKVCNAFNFKKKDQNPRLNVLMLILRYWREHQCFIPSFIAKFEDAIKEKPIAHSTPSAGKEASGEEKSASASHQKQQTNQGNKNEVDVVVGQISKLTLGDNNNNHTSSRMKSVNGNRSGNYGNARYSPSPLPSPKTNGFNLARQSSHLHDNHVASSSSAGFPKPPQQQQQRGERKSGTPPPKDFSIRLDVRKNLIFSVYGASAEGFRSQFATFKSKMEYETLKRNFKVTVTPSNDSSYLKIKSVAYEQLAPCISFLASMLLLLFEYESGATHESLAALLEQAVEYPLRREGNRMMAMWCNSGICTGGGRLNWGDPHCDTKKKHSLNFSKAYVFCKYCEDLGKGEDRILLNSKFLVPAPDGGEIHPLMLNRCPNAVHKDADGDIIYYHAAWVNSFGVVLH